MKKLFSSMAALALAAALGMLICPVASAAGNQTVKTVSIQVGSKAVTKKTVTVEPGESIALKVTCLPRKALKGVSYKSSDTSVATVSSKGRVRAKAGGNGVAKITVTAKSRYGKAKTSYVRVKVSRSASSPDPAPVPAEKTVSENLAEYSWGELSRISSEIAATSTQEEALRKAQDYGLLDSTGKLTGKEVKEVVLTNGDRAEVQILGFRHDDKAAGGKAGISFAFKDCIALRYMPSSEHGWSSTSLCAWVDNALFEYLPDDLRTAIVPVDKLTNNTGWTESVAAVTKTTQRLWLLSAAEVCGPWNNFEEYAAAKPGELSGFAFGNPQTLDQMVSAEGSQYKLYEDNGITDGFAITSKSWADANPLAGIDEGHWEYATKTTEQRFLFKDGSTSWVLRTPAPVKWRYGVTGFFVVSQMWASGNVGSVGMSYASDDWEKWGIKDGIAPGFCI